MDVGGLAWLHLTAGMSVQVGNAKFTQQHDAIQRLNLQVGTVVLCISVILTFTFVQEGTACCFDGTPGRHFALC
jgi:hypothetical protein